MTEQLSLVVLIVALATGLVTSIVVVAYVQVRQPIFSRYFLTNILLFNLLILSGLVFRYLQFEFQSSDLVLHPFVFPGLLAIMAALKLGWLLVFTIMNISLPADIVSKQLARLLVRAGGIIFVIYLGVMTTAWVMQNNGLLQVSSVSLEALIIGGALVASLRLLFSTKGLPKGVRRRSILTFAGYHLGLLGTILAVLVIGWLQPGPQRLTQLLTNGGFLVLFNVFPLVWIKWFQPLQPVSSLERLDVLGITKREREIIKLIQAGKTNQEIADDLFISVATVKDHNHNLFRKSSVRNRLELANLFR